MSDFAELHFPFIQSMEINEIKEHVTSLVCYPKGCVGAVKHPDVHLNTAVF